MIILQHDYSFASDKAFHTSCKDSIVLPVQSGTCQSFLDSSGFQDESIPRFDTPELENPRYFIAATAP
jgi:hypothetical protein